MADPIITKIKEILGTSLLKLYPYLSGPAIIHNQVVDAYFIVRDSDLILTPPWDIISIKCPVIIVNIREYYDGCHRDWVDVGFIMPGDNGFNDLKKTENFFGGRSGESIFGDIFYQYHQAI